MNREKVVRLILSIKRRGHRAYVHLDEEVVRSRAEKLPADGVPPELITLLPNDNSYDKLRMQKPATPVEAMDRTGAVAAKNLSDQRPLAVVLERSSTEQADAQIRQNTGLHTFLTRLGKKAELPAPQNSQNAQSSLDTEDRHCRQSKSHEIIIRSLGACSLSPSTHPTG